MSSTITIDTVKQTAKSLVLKATNGREYFAKKDSGLADKAGVTIEAETKLSAYNGKDYVWIEKWKAGSAGTPTPAASSQSAPELPPGKDNISPWWMPFVSNTVAHAIQAGRIESPSDIMNWAEKAYQAAHGLKGEDGRAPF